MISTRDMRILEDNAEYYGVSKLELMEHAGKAVADFVYQNYPNKRILVVCGHGNNGGDGFVAARYLYAPVYFVGDEFKLTREARLNYEKIKQRLVRQPNLKSYEVIIDALFGTGIHGPLTDHYRSVIKKINAAKKIVIAIDVPSGLDPDTGKGSLFVKPTVVLTFHDTKPCLKPYRKITTIVPIGIPKEAEQYCGVGELKALVKERPATAHKGDAGKVLIIGGSKDYVGAPLLAALAVAALRTGTDWVTVAAPEKVAWAINAYAPDIITKKISGDYFSAMHVKEILILSEQFDVILLGPGIGMQATPFVKQYVRKIQRIKKPLVIDADALKVLKIQDVKNALFTPHKKEFELLLKNSKFTQKNFQKKLGSNVVLVKGHLDEIFSQDKVKLNRTGNPGMTVGGTGDVLAGLCAGFAAQSGDIFTSACAAAFVNGMCGDECFKELGYGLIASDLLQKVAMVVHQFTV